jgi:hypothetical protein
MTPGLWASVLRNTDRSVKLLSQMSKVTVITGQEPWSITTLQVPQ